MKKSGKIKAVIGWIVAFFVAFLFSVSRYPNTVRNILETFRRKPLLAILVMAAAIAIGFGVDALKKRYYAQEQNGYDDR